MAIFDLYSKRQKRARGETPDVYTYDTFPQPLRVQLVQLIEEGLGDPKTYESSELYSQIHKTLCREYGVFSLSDQRRTADWEAIANTLLQTDDHEQILDIVELGLGVIDTYVRKEHQWSMRHAGNPDDVIGETNTRFKEHGVGYEFLSGELIRIDSQVVHNEVVKPALLLLSDSQYSGPNAEFLAAHDHYRHGRYKECLNECLKAFESIMKTICTKHNWPFNATDTAKSLIQVCMDNGLFPTFMQNHVSNLRVILESGVPTVRNKRSGHGQGPTVTTVSESTASFVLHTTATNILFFAQAEHALP